MKTNKFIIVFYRKILQSYKCDTFEDAIICTFNFPGNNYLHNWVTSDFENISHFNTMTIKFCLH